MISIVVVIVSDTTGSRYDTVHLEGTLEALAGQAGAPPMEIIVPYAPPLEGVARLAEHYPQARFVPVADLQRSGGASREHHDQLRARGLALARGELVALLEDHALPDPHWAAAMAEAHRERWAGVGGAIENGIDRALNWAVYFCDFAHYQNPLPAGESDFASDANACYKRAALETIEPIWREAFQERAVNWALKGAGEKLALAPEAIVYQHRLGLRLSDSLKERFVWGRSYAAGRCGTIGRGKQLAYAALAPAIWAVLVARMGKTVAARGRLMRPFLQALPLTAVLALAWSAGEMSAYLKGGGAPEKAVRETLARSAG
jgi:hypothetical protein